MKKNFIRLGLPAILAAVASLWTVSDAALAQIFVTNLTSNTVSKFALSGALLNPSLISGLGTPEGIAISGGNLFVTSLGADPHNGTIGEYTASGTAINRSLVTGLSEPTGIAVSGGNIFVVNYLSGVIGEYSTSGATVNASLITGLRRPMGIAVSGDKLFVTSYLDGTVGEYTTSGATVNAALITGLAVPQGIVASGSNLFVTDAFFGIGKYTTSGAKVNASLIDVAGANALATSGGNLYVTGITNSSLANAKVGQFTTSGSTVNASLITGLLNPSGVAILVPEPSTWACWRSGLVHYWPSAATKAKHGRTQRPHFNQVQPTTTCPPRPGQRILRNRNN